MARRNIHSMLSASLFASILFGTAACSSTGNKPEPQAATQVDAPTVAAVATADTTAQTADGAALKPESYPKRKSASKGSRYDASAIKSANEASADVEKAISLADAGDLSGAVAAMLAITSRYPKAFIAQYNLGILYERDGNESAARNAYRAALSAEPKFVSALIQMVRMDIRKNNPKAALQTANEYIISHPDVFDYNYVKIEALIADRQYDEVISLSRALLKKDEANSVLRYYLALTEFERGRYRLAEFIIGESLEIDADNADAVFLRARIHNALSAEDVSLIPGIASDLDKVLELNPNHFEALWMRGVIYYEASDYDNAEAFFRRMLVLRPSAVGGYINLANTLKTLDRGPEAENYLKYARSLEPENGLVDFSLGTLYLNTELIKMPMDDMARLKLARTEFENAVRHWTGDEDKELARGFIRTTDDAVETLQAMLDAQEMFGDDSGGEGADSDGGVQSDTGDAEQMKVD